MNNYENIFKPIKIGKIIVKNRIESSPAEPFLASRDGYVTREFIEWTRTMAKGGAGIVTIGDSPVNEEYAKESAYVINLSDDKVVNGLYTLTEVIHSYGSKASIELNLRTHYTPTDMTREKIKQVINDFAVAAYRCKVACMDMVMIHGGHGHLIAQFFSPFYNKRTDEYGSQTMENRARFAMELLDAVRAKIGDEMAIEYRISADELHENGVKSAEAIQFAIMIQNKIDLIHVSVGDIYRPETVKFMIQPTYIPKGVNVHYAEMFKKELSIPVVTVGSLDMDMAEQIIAEGKSDMVAMIRSFIADPDLVNKAKYGEAHKIRPCIRCTKCNMNSKAPHVYCLPVRCTVNPVNGREVEFMNHPLPEKKKKVVVVGGGPAGMEAARDAAGRGHEVVLFEKSDELGGALIEASASPLKKDMKKYLDWTVQMTMNTPNVKVKLSTEATIENLKAENPEAIVIAVGSEAFISILPGVDRTNVLWVGDVDMGKVQPGHKVVLAGAGLAGSETALQLAREGKDVTIIDMQTLEQIDANSPGSATRTLRYLLKQHGVNTITEVKLIEITDEGAVVTYKNSEKSIIPCDTVVLSLGVTPRKETVEKFENLVKEVYVIGDCNNPRGDLFNAITEGFYAAMSM